MRRTQLPEMEAAAPAPARSALPKIEEVAARLTPASRIAVATDPEGPAGNRFRLLRMRLWELRAAAGLQNILVSSPLPQDGKSTVVMNLAVSLSEGGKRSVLVLECDFHRPKIAKILGLPDRPGLVGCIEDGLDPNTQILKVNPLGCYLLQAGLSNNVAGLFQGNALGTLVDSLRSQFEWILLDTPPLLALTDAIALSKFADTSLVVARIGRTPRKAVEEALHLLGPKHVFGVIVNGEERVNKEYSLYGRYYR